MEGMGSPLIPRNFEMPFLEIPETSRCIECRVGFSRLRRVAGLSLPTNSLYEGFSWSWGSGSEAETGTGLPESGNGPKTRFRGLFGDPRVRDVGLDVAGLVLAERSDSLMFDLKGVDAVWEGCGVKNETTSEDEGIAAGKKLSGAGDGGVKDSIKALRAAAGAAGVPGASRFGDAVLDAEPAEPAKPNFEGDRERDFRNDRTAELTST